ncbi:MAG TPA: lipoprotein [Steroidobacteraceae bacterium]
MKMAILGLMVCGAFVVAGCGQKGALYLPDKNASVVTRPAGAESNNPAPAQPAPAPSQQPRSKDNDDSSGPSKPKS